ncbi:MAG: flagellin lysine-N-methylase [Oscillibacter sp.]|nr:flagellin lysine-N-methylase [Oscillibacter sp.]
MKHITIGEINKFQCVGSQCPYSCCAGGWAIIVDKVTDEYYQAVEGDFGEELRTKIDRTRDPACMKLTPNGRCAFLNDENLCRVYIELGPEHMCDTCRVYPRQERVAGDRVLHYMTISCPEVGRIFLSRKTPLEFHTVEDKNSRVQYPVPSPDWHYFRLAEKAFQVNFDILRNQSLDIAQRERALLLFNRALQDALDAEKWEDAEKLFAFFSAPENYLSMTRSQLSGHLASKVRFFRDLCELVLKREGGSKVYQMFVFSIRYILSEQADMDALSECLHMLDGEEYQREEENLLTYFLFHFYLDDTLLDKSANRDLFQRLVFILSVYQFYRVFTAIFSSQKKEIMPLEERVLTVAFLSRYFEHSPDKFRKQFNETLAQHQFYDMGFLFQLIS